MPTQASSTRGSYHISQFAADADAEMDRLNAQVDLFWAQELQLYLRLGIHGGMTVLDCGCGTGYLLHKLKEGFPALDCTGVEQDNQLVQIAARETAGLSGCSILNRSILELGLPANSFDLAIARLVLEHLTDPAAALREIHRVLKPSGIAVLIDNDFDLHERTWPACPSLAHLYDAYRQARQTDGGNPCIGRELPGLLADAGFANTELHLLSAHSRIVGDDLFLAAEGPGIPAQLVKAGFLTPALLNQIADEWVHMLGSPGHAIFRLLFAAVGRKSGETTPARSAAASATTAPNIPSPLPDSLANDNDFDSPDAVRRFIQSTLAEDMEVAADALPFHQSLLHLGVTSMSAVRLCNQVKSRLAVSISMADVLCGKCIDELTQQVLALRQANNGPREESRPIPLRSRS